MSVRVRPALHALLQEAAEKSGRTLSQEVEFRIETSFMREVRFAEIAESALKHMDAYDRMFAEWGKVLDDAKADLERHGTKANWEKPK
jgi:hypothetical protein